MANLDSPEQITLKRQFLAQSKNFFWKIKIHPDHGRVPYVRGGPKKSKNRKFSKSPYRRNIAYKRMLEHLELFLEPKDEFWGIDSHVGIDSFWGVGSFWECRLI